MKKDGSWFWASDMGKRVWDEDGEEVIYCFIADISEKKERELQAELAGREAARQTRFSCSFMIPYPAVFCSLNRSRRTASSMSTGESGNLTAMNLRRSTEKNTIVRF